MENMYVGLYHRIIKPEGGGKGEPTVPPKIETKISPYTTQHNTLK
jgi:hypothetical protein